MPTAFSILLSLPLKRCPGGADALAEGLAEVLGSKQCETAELCELRRALEHACASPAQRKQLQEQGGGAAGAVLQAGELRECVSRYLRCLSSLTKRFPILENEGTLVPCFTWHNAFHPSKSAAQHSLRLERAGCLYNLATATCHQALACDKTTPEGAKAASLLFQEAAGTFHALQHGEVTHALAPLPDDMTPACLRALTKLMLVQAQQCEYRKAVLQRIDHRETARLSEQLSVLYKELQRELTEPALSKVFDPSMVSYTAFKASLYRAEALSQIGKALHSEGSLGKAIRVLKDASQYLQGTKELAKAVSEAMAGSVVKIQESVKKALALVKRDNTVDNQPVPASIEVDITLLGALLAQPILPTGLDAPPESEDTFLAHLGPRSRPVQRLECMATLTGHTGEVRGVAISSDGDHIVSGSADGTVMIWGVPEELIATCQGHADEVTCVAIAPDCSYCVSGSRDKTAKVWELTTGRLIATLSGHSAVVSCVAISPDSSTCYLGSYDDTISIWDLATAQCQGTLNGHDWGLTGLALTADGMTCVSSSGDETVKVWDLATGTLRASSQGMGAYINGVAANPSGNTCVSVAWDDSIRIWDLSTGQVRASIKSGTRVNFCVAITPAGTSCVTGADDDHIRMWDLVSGQLAAVMDGHTNDVICLAVSPDGTICVSGSDDGTVRVWDIAGQDANGILPAEVPEL